MKKYIHTRLILVVVVAAFAVACSTSSADDNKQAKLDKLRKEHAEIEKQIKDLESQIAKANPEKNLKAKEVTVTAIEPRSFDHYVQTQGLVESENNILVSAKSMGVVTNVYAREGQTVSKGQTLAQIDNSVILRQIESMKSQLELANTVFQRQENLWKQKIGTEVQYLQAKTNKESLEKQIAGLEEQNAMTRITSPISGTVDAVEVKVGQNIAPGMPAARVVNGNDLKLTARVSEAYINQVKKGNRVIISISELKKDINAKVDFVGRTIDPLSRTFPVEVALKSMPELRPNMTATIKVIFETSDNAIVVPVNVIQSINNEKVVYVAEKDGNKMVARRKVVTVNGVYNAQAQVDGLKAGEQVITFGYQGLNDGELIKI